MASPDDAVILVVDDEPDVAAAYATHAREQYGDVRIATSGDEALEMVDDDVDVVLLDRRMPEPSGDEVLAVMRERGLDCRVAMVTAIDADFDIIDMEFDDYVVKPVTRRELLDTVDRLLRCAEYERTLREYYRVTRKLATLESTKDAEELSEREDVRDLIERRDDLSETLSSATETLADDDFETLFSDLDQGRPDPA